MNDIRTTTVDAAGPSVDALDPDRIEAFAGRVLGVIADASTALVLSIGHRTRLFDVLAELPPSTSAEVARAAGLHERYVREWLAAMLVGGVVVHDPGTDTWSLPAEHAAVLTRAAGPDNLAKLAQFIGLLAGVEHQVVRCFPEGGGVPYSAYTEFHALMGEESKDQAEGILLDQLVPLVDGLADRLARGVAVADIGCGSGHHLSVLAGAYPASSFVGYDFSDEAIAQARVTAEMRGLANVRFESRDVVDLSGTGPFDLVTAFDAIHDQAHPAMVLRGIADVLAPDGVFLMGDIKASSRPDENVDLPAAPFLYAISLMHCMTVSLAQGGTGLGAVWGEQTATRMLREAGLGSVEVRVVEGDFVNSYYIARLGRRVDQPLPRGALSGDTHERN
ncbi:MAG: class I SAM-dependent methyltransferase [Nocardioides sp.]|nr:class I SAM-dependent methyltransferase [Nocardioides sp.]